MRDRKFAVASAVTFALLVGLPVSAAAIWQTAAARDALVARRSLESSVETARVAMRRSAAMADAEAFAQTVRIAEARRRLDPVVDHVRATAERVSERVVPYAEYAVTLGQGETWRTLASRWGLDATELAALNPGVDLQEVGAGASLSVFRLDPNERSSSRGSPSRGRLLHGMPMPEGEHWTVRNPRHGWGTPQAISALVRGFTHVGETLPGGGQPLIADLSARNGGRLSRHRSHTSGRDVDSTYFQVDASRTGTWVRVRASELDTARQWALFKYWIERDEVTYIFADRRLRQALYNYAVSIGEPEELLHKAFTGGSSSVIRHAPGHADHFHARFRCAPDDAACREV